MRASWNSPKLRRAAWVVAGGIAILGGYAASSLPISAAASNVPAVVPQAPVAPKTVVAAALGPAVLPVTTLTPAVHPLAHLSARELQELAVRHPEELGPAILGRPNRGRLLNGIPLAETPGIRVMNGAQSFGTEATVRSIEAAVAEVLRAFPDSKPLAVGDLSRRGGGYLRPHRSHQTGVDVDLGYYYVTDSPWYTKANAENLDRARTWALLKALVNQGNVQYVFMDRAVQGLLGEYALAQGEQPELVSSLFESKQERRALVRHARRHLTHFHVRFHDPVAEETGRRLVPYQKRLRRF